MASRIARPQAGLRSGSCEKRPDIRETLRWSVHLAMVMSSLAAHSRPILLLLPVPML